MTSKIQGEGDYESARRYNRHVEQSVKKGIPKKPIQGENAESLRQAEQAGKARAKQGHHDAKDAKLMKNYVTDSQHKN